jgi:hypothetical protein
MNTKLLLSAAALALIAGSTPAIAADWSDTSVGLRYGTAFSEPYDPETKIKKWIVDLQHASGFKYGTNFFNVDFLQSNHNDPAGGVPGNTGAQEVYGVYRNTLDFTKITGINASFPGVRGFGLTSGFDLNSKNDGYASKKRMVVVGPTMFVDVPGFLNVSVEQLWESNSPYGLDHRYYYKTHPMLDADFGIGIGSLPLSFNGYAQWIAAKGKNEFGGATAPETHIDAELMWDVGLTAGGPKHTFLIGLEYEYWRNKFGNPTTSSLATGAGPGATAKTPMVRAEYHF